ncbi:helix-turn-helix transcriptional regulator [Leptolyngbya sp. 7M]|uniref:helix-turn-helix transcriptional regulator n=1 Tax=Leptolyngbya sp. 7M TaxID=2812896 RepID=UPI001B8D16E7|nr:AraC family transcriptional regulator [Leptolyngbya sp. 7M]QYO62335.1 AraC family transcriptional regulator [Leptolyngbya sp. 7M]
MAIILSEQDWYDLWEEGRQAGTINECSNDFETHRQGYCRLIGQVHEWCMELQEGLEICGYDYHLTNHLRLTAQNQDCVWSVLSFFVAGDSHTILHGLTDYVDEASGRTYLSCFANVDETEDWAAEQRMLRVQVCVNPAKFLKNFASEHLQSLPREIRQAAAGKIQPYYYLSTITPMMQTVIHQILDCPYQGLMKRLYLEGKALELITLRFCQLQETSQRSTKTPALKSDDIDRIYQARAILIENLENPPSLLGLARQVGLNDCTLKRGFRQVFGKSAFGYLHDYRLEQARQLLEQRRLNVSEVCRAVGFANRSYFASAFRKKFGINPKDYLYHKNSA